ncbi:MAG TPA: hypothetical protein VHB69_11270 [Mycobacteriales bacterium]|nr:hypothetical protein [Mycobacteriales bacterium]
MLLAVVEHGGASAARVAGPPGPVRDLVATAYGDTATVSWRPPRHGEVARYQVEAHLDDYYNETSPGFGTRVVGGATHSIVWPDLPLNLRVYFTVTPVAAGAAGAAGAGSGIVAWNATGPVVPANSHCPTTLVGDCVVVDPAESLGVETRPGAGILHGVVSTGNRWVRPLNLTHWRIDAGNAAQFHDASAAVGPSGVIEMLSDAWYAHTHHRVRGRSYAADPWSDWSSYAGFVARQVREAARRGDHPIWDIQNEPEGYIYDPGLPVTKARVEKEYLVAYRAIKRVDRDAKVIGPSIGWTAGTTSATELDMATFVSYAAAHHMRLYALSWHENSDRRDASPLTYQEMPQAVRDEAEQVRELIAEHPAIGDPKLWVDENSSAAGQYIPGFTAGYLAAEDQAGLAEANRSCWSYPGTFDGNTCFRANLGGLLNHDGAPNANYWVMRDYAELSGTRVASATSALDVSALAVTDPRGTTRVLIGRHQTCSQPTTGPGYCAGPPRLAAPAALTVRVLVPAGASSAVVGVQVVPDTLRDMTRPPATAHSVVPVRSGVATIGVPALGDGEALFVTVRPDATGGRPPRSGDRQRREVPAPRGAAVPTRLFPLAGADQSVAALHPYPQPLTALLTDQYGNPLAHEKVTFSLGRGGHGHFTTGGTTTTLTTNGDGIATSPTVVDGLPIGDWNAAAYLASAGPAPGAPIAYYLLASRAV